MTEFAPGFCPELGRKCVDARLEIERLHELLKGPDPHYDMAREIGNLRAAGDAAFLAMCAYRDGGDKECFQDAIDELGMALGRRALEFTAPLTKPTRYFEGQDTLIKLLQSFQLDEDDTITIVHLVARALEDK